ncbi:MAG: hypothetical protein ACRD1N_10415, partial [Terriglobia bacterium]
FEQLGKEPRILNLQKSVVSDPFLQHAVRQAGEAEDAKLSVIEQTVSKSHEDFETQYAAAVADVQAEQAGLKEGHARLAAIDRDLDRLLGGLALSRNEIEIADRKFTLAQQAFETASREYLNASISVSSKSQDLRQLAPATVPEHPVRPLVLLNTLLAALLALVVLTTAAAIVEGVRETAASVRDADSEREEAVIGR